MTIMKITERTRRVVAWLLLFAVALNPVGAYAQTQTITHFHNDIAGSPLAATNEAGSLVWQESYRPYGERIQNPAAASANKLWFHGKPVDDDSGLSYFGARWYDPVVGRFMGVDPERFSDENLHSFNRYTYANDNPYKFVDPDGRWAWLTSIAAAASNLYARAQVAAGRLMQSPIGQWATQYLAGEAGTPQVAPITAAARALTTTDLGIKGSLTQLSGTISLNQKQLNITIDMIEGRIENILNVVPHLKDTATKLGAHEVRIEATIANEPLERLLHSQAVQQRFGITVAPSSGKYREVISIPIHINQVPD